MKRLALFFCLLSIVSLNAFSKVFFDASMASVPGYYPQIAVQDQRWQLLKSLYESYENKEGDYAIPKTIHLIWLGSPLPPRCQAMLASWQKFHPSWTVKLWTDREAAAFPFINRAAFDRAKNYGEKSDIWRYEILYQHGGLYVDTDFECLRAFDDLHRSCEFYTGIGQNTSAQLWIGVIGSKAGHPILKAVIDNLRAGPGDQDFERIMNDTGAYLFTKMFFAQAAESPLGTVIPFPVTVFYPFPGGLRGRKDQENIKSEFVRPETLAIHYFATSWQ